MLRLFLVGWACALCVLPAQAVDFLPLSLEELAAQAEAVAQGVVLRRSCQQDGDGRIYTRIELQLKEVWKGRPPGPVLTLVQGGGVLGEKRAQVIGQAEFTVGEEVVVFVVFNARGEAVTLGLRQGKFHVQPPVGGGEALAGNGFAHAARPASPRAALTAPAAPPPRAWLPLSELRRRVQETEGRP